MVLDKVAVSANCKGFQKGTSIVDNVMPHIRANAILSLDLANFFDTIDGRRVFLLFRSLGYNDLIASLFTNICIFKNRLPQGSPCSPKLANIISWKLDIRIQAYVGKRGITYTRYADDMTFSGLHPKQVKRIYPVVEKIIEQEQFELNEAKTRVATTRKAKKVTGLIISGRSFGVGHKQYRLLRSRIHHLTKEDSQNEKLLNSVQGYLYFLKSVDLKRFNKVKEYINNLKEKHPNTLVQKLLTDFGNANNLRAH